MKFQNNSFIIEAQEEPGCRLSLEIQASSEEARKAYKQAIKAVNREISIPGFRKGKAPDATVIKNYNSQVDKEWKELLLNGALQAAFELTNIYPLNKNSIEKPRIEKCSLEEGALIHLAYECYPKVPSIDFSRIKLPHIEKIAPSEVRMDEILLEIQRANADWEDVSGRAVKEGDYVDLTIDAVDEEPPKSIVKDRRFEVSLKRMAPWLFNILIGQETGATLETISEVDDKADESVKAKFKPTQVRIILHAIKKIVLPPLTDELAQKAGGSSLEDLKHKIHANLEQEADEEFKQKRYHELEKALLDHYPFDVPVSLARKEKEQRLKAKIQELKNQKISDEEIKSKEKELKEEVDQEVDQALRLYFLGKQIVQQGNISVSNQELNNELVKQIQQNPQYFGRDMDKETSREVISRISSALMDRKAKEYALSQTELSH